MQIIIDTASLSELDIAMLAFLAGQEPAEEPAEEAPTPEPAKKAPKKAAPKKAEPEPEPEPEDEDLVGGEAPTMSDAVAAATKLVSSGKAAEVKAALATVNAKRVSEIQEGDIAAFLAALEG